MQGMSFLIAQMLLCLIVAAVIGGLIGWLLRGSKITKLNGRIDALESDYHNVKNEFESLNTRYRDDMDEKDRTIAEYSSKLTLFESKSVERDSEITRLNADYTARLGELEEEIDRLNYIREDIKVKDTTIARLESDLRQQQDVSAAIAKQANLSSEEMEAIGAKKGGPGWFDIFKNPDSGSTLDSKVGDDDTPKWASGIKATLASGGAAIAGVAASRSSKADGGDTDADSKSWVETAKERVKDATQNISEKAKEATHNVSEKAKEAAHNVSDKVKGAEDGDASQTTDSMSSAKKSGADGDNTDGSVERGTTSTSDTKSGTDSTVKNDSSAGKVDATSAAAKSSESSAQSSASKAEDEKSEAGGATARASATAGVAAAATASVVAGSAKGQDDKSSVEKSTAKTPAANDSAKKELSASEQERIRQIRESRGVRIESAIFEGKPTDLDDLKEIYGIGPVMEGILNDLGIYSFAQLATLDDIQLEKLRDSIGTFRNRVDRDDWLGGARKCYGEKYGKSI